MFTGPSGERYAVSFSGPDQKLPESRLRGDVALGLLVAQRSIGRGPIDGIG